MGVTLQETKVSKAVTLMLSFASKKKTNDVLSEEYPPVHLQIAVKKIPKVEKYLKLKLPNPISKPDADVCIFVKDLDKNDRDTEPTISHFEELLAKKGVTNVKEIVPIKGLKTDYKPFESKWNLSNAYDIFLADERIVSCLPRLLGKYFYGRKKSPTQFNVTAMDLKAEIHRAINTSKFLLSAKGSTSTAVVGHSGMNQEEITANVLAAVEQISEAIPGSSDNIKQLCIKVRSSTSVPIYLSQGGPQDITVPNKKKTDKGKPIIDEISTQPDAKVAVYPDGRVIVLKDGQTLKDFKEKERKSKSIDLKRKREESQSRKLKKPAKKAKRANPPVKGKKLKTKTKNKIK